MKKNYSQIFLIIEVQLILILMIFIAFNMNEFDAKLRRTNIFISGIFQNKQLEAIQEITRDDIVIGQDNAPVTIIMYSKYDCSACQDFHTTTYDEIKTNYIDKGLVKFVVRHLTHEIKEIPFYSVKCAQYAYENNVFEKYNEQLLKKDFLTLDTLKIRELTLDLIPDTLAFSNYVESNYINKTIKAKASQGRKTGINRTPTFIINGKKIVGNRRYEKFEELILSGIGADACEE